MRRSQALFVSVAMCLAAGCRAQGSEGSGGTSSSAVTVEHAVTPVVATDGCPQEAAVLQSLIVAYVASFGALPTDEADFVTQGLHPIDLPSIDLTAAGAVPTAGDCRVRSFVGVLDDVPAECADELDRLTIDAYVGGVFGGGDAAIARAHQLGVDHGPFVLYSTDDLAAVTPVTGACPTVEHIRDELAAATTDGIAHICEVHRVTLETAVETYVAAFGAQPPDMQVLLDEELIRALIDDHDVVLDAAGVAQVVPRAGGPCAA